MKTLGITLGLCASIAIRYVCVSFTLWQLARWFIYPAFQIPEITVAQAAGLLLILDHLRSTQPIGPGEWSERILRSIGRSTSGCAFTLLLGAIIRLFV